MQDRSGTNTHAHNSCPIPNGRVKGPGFSGSGSRVRGPGPGSGSKVWVQVLEVAKKAKLF